MSEASLGARSSERQHLRYLEPVVLVAVGREQDVGEEPLEAVAGVARPVLHVVAHGGLQPRHERRRRRAELLCNITTGLLFHSSILSSIEGFSVIPLTQSPRLTGGVRW